MTTLQIFVRLSNFLGVAPSMNQIQVTSILGTPEYRATGKFPIIGYGPVQFFMSRTDNVKCIYWYCDGDPRVFPKYFNTVGWLPSGSGVKQSSTGSDVTLCRFMEELEIHTLEGIAVEELTVDSFSLRIENATLTCLGIIKEGPENALVHSICTPP